MNKTASLVIGLAIIAGVGGIVWYQLHADSAAMPQDTSMQPASPQGDGAAVSGPGDAQSTDQAYTMADVATHNSQASCWTVIDGSVYDLTQWISKHPGGPQAILALCGRDGTAAFRDEHDHAQRQENVLAGFKIGTLSQ